MEPNRTLDGMARPLIDWYRLHVRPLPWRENPTPYRVWVSEIMLQQTRIEAVLPYFDRFMAALPDVAALAGAEEELLLKLWEGLGYYSRVRHMQKAARMVMEEYGGRIPTGWRICSACPGSETIPPGPWRPSPMAAGPRRWTETYCGCLPG